MMIMVKVVATKEMIKCFTFRKEEREKQNWFKAKVYDRFLFCTQNTIEGVSDLGSIAVLEGKSLAKWFIECH